MIKKIRVVAYKLDLFVDALIYPVFYVSQFRKATQYLSFVPFPISITISSDLTPVTVLDTRMVKCVDTIAT